MRRVLLALFTVLHVIALVSPLFAFRRHEPPRFIEHREEAISTDDYLLAVRSHPLFTACEQEYLLRGTTPYISISVEKDVVPAECVPAIGIDFSSDLPTSPPPSFEWMHWILSGITRMLHI